MKETCPLCNKRFADLLDHLANTHQTLGLDQLRAKISENEDQKQSREEFSKLVEALTARRARNEITAEDYRNITEAFWKRRNNVNKEN